MSEYHLSIRAVHIACAYISIGLFVLRHVLNLSGIHWRKSRALRIMPHVVDTLLLGAGLALMFNLGQYPFIDAWLTVKVMALVVYIGLANLALRPSGSALGRRGAFLAAAATFAFILSVASTHSPWGVLARFQ